MKALLLLLAITVSVFAAEKPKDITQLITSATWKWDHPTAKGRMLKFKKDGTCETTHWNGVWKVIGPRSVSLTQSGNKQTKITFSEDFGSFTGTHHDGLEVVGKRLGDLPASVR
jgi:hypothetical protein